MTKTWLTCDRKRLRQSLDDQLSEQDEEDLARHLTECPSCQRELEALAAGQTEWSQVVEVLQQEAVSGRASLAADGGHGVAWDSEADFAVEFLEPSTRPGVLGRLGDIEILGVIGRGGMGLVLKGFQPELHRAVAVKVLAPHLAVSGAARQRFAREARATAVVVHPNVMPVLTVHSSGKLPYLVMPYVPCQSLQQRLDRHGALELSDVLRIACQVSRALAAAHAQGLVHRDVKPANILLEEGVDRVLLTDFGLARAVDDASLTRTGVIAGTPPYMSPEQARGELLDARSDLFSLGSVMYAMVTGRPPFRAETSYGILRRITDTEPRPIHAIQPETPDWIAGVIAKLHAKDPDARFTSADELSHLLEQCLAHVRQPSVVPLPKPVGGLRPLRQRQPSVAVRGGKRLNRVLSLGFLGTLFVVLAVGAGIFFHRQRAHPRWQPSRTARSAVPLAPPADARPTPGQGDPHEQLRQRLSVNLQAVPLPDALKQIAEKTRTTIVLDEESIRQAGIAVDLPVTIETRVPESVSAILNLILQPRNLGYVVEGRSIKVTTREVVEDTLYVRVYPVADLVASVEPRYDFRELISLITSTVGPESWDAIGGPGRIDAFQASLVIAQTQPRHEEIADLLGTLRRTAVEDVGPPAEPAFKEPPNADGGNLNEAFEVNAGREVPMRRLPALGRSSGRLWYLPDGKTLISSFGGKTDEGIPTPNDDPRRSLLTFWDTATWQARTTLDPLNTRHGVWPVDISRDGSRLAFSVWTESLSVWDIQSFPLPAQPLWRQARREDHAQWEKLFNHVAFSPDGKLLASVETWRPPGGDARTGRLGITVYNAAYGQQLHRVSLRGQIVPPMEFSPDGRTLVVSVLPAAGKAALQMIDTATWKITRGVDQRDIIRLLGYPIHQMRHLPDGRFLAASAGYGVLLLDGQTGRFELLGRHPIRPYPGWGYTVPAVPALTLSRDGRLLATGGHEDRPTIRVWDLTTRRQMHKLQHPAGYDVVGLAFSPDGTQLVSGAYWDEDGGGVCCLWELATPETEASYQN